MHRASVHRWIAALALGATLGLMGAQPAAAADLRVVDRLASLWSTVTERPVALWETLINWLGTEKPPSPDEKQTNGSDPNGTTSPAAVSAPTDPTVGSW